MEFNKKISQSLTVNLAYYPKKDWERLVKLREDKANQHDTWEEWQQEFQNTKQNLEKQGLAVSKCVVNADELLQYCFERELKLNGKTCSQFVSEKGLS